MKKYIIVGGIAVAVLYVASPYFTLWSIYHSAKTGDTMELEEKVDWGSLRQSLKEQVNAAITKGSAQQLQKGGDNFSAGIAAFAGPMFVDRAVDGFVNAKSFVELVQETEKQDPKPVETKVQIVDETLPSPAPNLKKARVAYAFFSSPTRFRVDLGEPAKGYAHILMKFGIGGWQVYRVVLPDKLTDELSEKMGSIGK